METDVQFNFYCNVYSYFSACDDDSWGQDCDNPCSTGCSDVCNKEDGTCQCKNGWIGPRCQQSIHF